MPRGLSRGRRVFFLLCGGPRGTGDSDSCTASSPTAATARAAAGAKLLTFEEAMPECFGRQGEDRAAAATRKRLKEKGVCGDAARLRHSAHVLYAEDGPAMRGTRCWFDEVPTVVCGPAGPSSLQKNGKKRPFAPTRMACLC